MRSIFLRSAKWAASIDWTGALDSNELNMLIILMIPDLGQAFTSHRTKIFLRRTNSALIITLCRALENQSGRTDEFVSSTLLLWWIRRNLSRLRFFLGAAAR